MNVNEAVRKTLNGVLIDVEVVPGANKKGLFFDGWSKRIKVKVKGRASSGKTQSFSKDARKMPLAFSVVLKDEANDEMLGFFSELFNSKVKIFSGGHSRKKTVFIENINPDDAARKIEEMMK